MAPGTRPPPIGSTDPVARRSCGGRAAAVSPAVEQLTGSPGQSLETFAREHAEAWEGK